MFFEEDELPLFGRLSTSTCPSRCTARRASWKKGNRSTGSGNKASCSDSAIPTLYNETLYPGM